MKFKSVEVQKNAKILTAFLKNRSKYLESIKLLLNLSDIKVYFFRIASILSKTFLKKVITILSIQPLPSFRGCIRKISK